MLKLLRYLKPYRLLIAVAVVLLFVQAMADLSLPTYLADIVNDGIQQGGVTEAAPVVIRQSEMERVLTFLTPEDKARVLADYTLLEAGTPAYIRYAPQFPGIANQPTYVQKNLAASERAWLDPVFGKALLITGSIEQMAAGAANADPAKAAAAQATGIDLSRVPPGTDLFKLLPSLPDAQRQQMTAAIDKQFAGLSPSMVTQAAARLVKAEYQALGVDPVRYQSRYILRTGRLMLLVSLLSAFCVIVVGLLSALIGSGFGRDVRRAVFQTVEGFSSAEIDKFSTASLITRSTNDVTQIQMLVIMSIRMFFYAPIMAVGGVIKAVQMGHSMWWLIGLAVVVLIAMVGVVFASVMPRFRRIQSLIDRLNRVTRENLSGMMVIRAFNRQPFELDRFDAANRDLTGTMLFVTRVFAVMMPVMMLIMNALSLAIIWVGSNQVAQSGMQVGDMMAFLQYAMQIVFAFLMLSFMFIMIPRASVSGDRIAEVIDTQPSIRDPQQPQRFPQPAHGLNGRSAGASLEFNNVSFRYPGSEEDVLQGITFTARPGQTTAFIGPTGSGKSTLVNLIPRFYDVTGGSICIDGVDVRAVTQHDLRERIGYAPQKATLFQGTIESNLRYADEDASEEKLAKAAAIAQAEEFIASRPEGMNAEIAQGGANVSGGQKQRLSIARALVDQPPLYIFDDSFSALDFRTDAALRRALHDSALHGSLAESTVLVVTQRVGTIKNADQIIVLEDGRIVGKGTHRELLMTCETYREIASSQLSKEELA